MIRQRLTIALVLAVLGLVAACGGEEQAAPTSTPKPEARPAPKIEHQSQALMLRLHSPEVNLVTELDRVFVSGVTSPDATISVNGRLALPDHDGNFMVYLDRDTTSNPLIIEVVATSITGETESAILPVIFSDGGEALGVFGTVTSVSPAELTLQTTSGQISLATDSETTVTIHGWGSPSVTNIAKGTLVAAMTDGQHADSVLAVLTRPAQTRHFTGILAGIDDPGSLTLQGNSGRQITAITSEISDFLGLASVGEVVTAVLKQDLATGDLTVTAIDRALAGAERLNAALALNQQIDSVQASTNISALRWRLAEHGVGNLTMLVDSQPYDAPENALKRAGEFYAKVFSENQIGAPSADVTGLVTSIDSAKGQITVQPVSGQPVMVKISANTPVALFGERVKSGQLDLASRITIRYSISGNNASRVTVMAGNTLSKVSAAQLAATAGRGEVQGVLMDVGPETQVTIMVDRATGEKISLQTAGSAVLRNGMIAKLDRSMEGSEVFARFDPISYRLLELESLTPARNEELVSGVVQSFIPKVSGGNLTIRTPDGRLRSFTHNTDTAIRRDGLWVFIQDVKAGDLVRPNTRVRSLDGGEEKAGEIIALSLKSAEPGLVTGIIRGVTAGLGGEVRVTLSNIWFDLISLKVDSKTAITQQGRTLGTQDLVVGQGISLASYDLVTLVAGVLALDPPRNSARASR
ncbi:MAG: hypothetical protein FI723_01205 [SAR202 cluster bacterium]|nr:hypothetical protein [SAR202 cluster bacterium]